MMMMSRAAMRGWKLSRFKETFGDGDVKLTAGKFVSIIFDVSYRRDFSEDYSCHLIKLWNLTKVDQSKSLEKSLKWLWKTENETYRTIGDEMEMKAAAQLALI